MRVSVESDTKHTENQGRGAEREEWEVPSDDGWCRTAKSCGCKVGRWGRGHSLASDELQLVKVKATEWPICTIFCRLLAR